MEYLEGGALIVLGILIMIFGGSSSGSGSSGADSRLALPAWLDNLLKWVIGILCIWFGANLATGHSHFF
jgi:hypothetical protein